MTIDSPREGVVWVVSVGGVTGVGDVGQCSSVSGTPEEKTQIRRMLQ